MWRRATLDDWIILGCAALLVVDSFAPWYFSDVGGTDRRNAWHGPGLPFAVLAIVVAVAMAALVLWRLRGPAGQERASGAERVRLAGVFLLGGAVAFLAVIVRMRAGSDEGSWGLYLGLVLTGGLLFAGLGHWRTAGGRWPGDRGRGPGTGPPRTAQEAPPARERHATPR
jgi:hypothetical protein